MMARLKLPRPAYVLRTSARQPSLYAPQVAILIEWLRRLAFRAVLSRPSRGRRWKRGERTDRLVVPSGANRGASQGERPPAL